MNPLVKTFMRRRGAAAAVSAAVMVAVLAGCAVAGPAAVATPAGSTAGTASVDSSTGWVRIVLRFDQEVVAASLADTPPAREFAAMLPLELHLGDPMGQAKSGPLPSPIDITGAATVTDPAVGEIYYWPDSATIAIFYDDLGQSVPPPGMVRLGTVDGGVDTIADAGNRITLRMDLANGTRI